MAAIRLGLTVGLVVWITLTAEATAKDAVALNLAEYKPAADGVTDDTPALARCFADLAKRGGGLLTIPPGDYYVAGQGIPLTSNLAVFAHGARFHLPPKLGRAARIELFRGSDITKFSWQGGEFLGHCFDPAKQENSWEPNVCTRIFVITTTREGKTGDLLFRDVRAQGIAGGVIDVHGLGRPGSESETLNPAARIAIESCTLLESGKFMWDYGYLWQLLCYPEEYQPWEVVRARNYFPPGLVLGGLKMANGDDRVQVETNRRPAPVSQSAEPKEAICFFGGKLPKNIRPGVQYFVVESTPSFIRVATEPRGKPIQFDGDSDEGVALMRNMFEAYLALYAPESSGPGKGGIDLQHCRDVRVTGCQLSARGDTMHIYCTQNTVFANNQIVGSRMGAFFIAEYCKNATITGNTIDGTNGSRVMSIEKSTEDITIVGNTFRNGGRGSWINQPKNFILQGNLFVNNTTKGERDPRRGRRSYVTGQYQSFPELYFTRYETDGKYGPVIVRDNIFQTGQSCGPAAVLFAGGGFELQMTGNVFRSPTKIRVDPSTTGVVIDNNPGAEVKREAVGFNEGRR